MLNDVLIYNLYHLLEDLLNLPPVQVSMRAQGVQEQAY